MKAAGKGKLRRKTIPRGDGSGLEFSRMPLNLVAVLIDAPEKVCAAMNIQHDTVPRVGLFLAFVIVRLHLDPFGFERDVGFTPLPPFLAADATKTFRAKLLGDECCGARHLALANLDLVDAHPLRMGHPSARECLKLFDRVTRRVGEEGTNEMQAFVVRYVRRGLLTSRSSIKVLPIVSIPQSNNLNDTRR
jgi:hypothetical protein